MGPLSVALLSKKRSLYVVSYTLRLRYLILHETRRTFRGNVSRRLTAGCRGARGVSKRGMISFRGSCFMLSSLQALVRERPRD
ncbi:hypothetical protein AVEN_56354-1 [Araneus ventricosus]|uniref:Uncharacterized protein n=1 Tax=Araneus ventricosus TaxID=182803 RepID=A0A4Y2LN26_ARAVE|nr:hypothetical protein AVEN_56354-1 [Araneus ventricosus]